MAKSNEIWRVLRACYLQPAFVICIAVLALSGSGMSITIERLGGYLKKEPLPLKNPLYLLDEGELGGYRVVQRVTIDNKDVVESMGTEEYIQWRLEDTSAPVDSSVRFCVLFITYYELPDNVPHVPEECYTGGGFQKLSSEDVRLVINREQTEQRLDVHYVVFAGTSSGFLGTTMEFPVLYILNVNGRYVGGREDARIILNRNLFGRHSYFSKIEWKFFGSTFGGPVYPGKEEAISASEKLLSILLPVLDAHHWPAGQWR